MAIKTDRKTSITAHESPQEAAAARAAAVQWAAEWDIQLPQEMVARAALPMDRTVQPGPCPKCHRVAQTRMEQNGFARRCLACNAMFAVSVWAEAKARAAGSRQRG